MSFKLSAVCFFAAISTIAVSAQIRRTSVPLGDTLTKAIAKSSLTGSDAEPFHIRIEISEPENPQSPYKGAIEEWWASPQQWRREVTTPAGMKQIIVVSAGSKTEQDSGDYFPLWLRSFVTAAFDPVPDTKAWDANAQIEQVFMPNGGKSDACARNTSRIGAGEHASTAYWNVCFDDQGRLKFIGSPRYSMSFSNYIKFGKLQVPEHFGDDPEPGTALSGVVVQLDKLAKVHPANSLFAPLAVTDVRFNSSTVDAVKLEGLTAANGTIIWPPVHSGNIRGHVAMYISVDNTGQVREAWPLASDNAGLEDPARAQVMQWKIQTSASENGNPTQLDGPLSFAFATSIGDPLPELTNAEVRRLATQTAEPVWPKDGLSAGQIISIQISIDERGELTGFAFSRVPAIAQGSVMKAIRQWKFAPFEGNGHAQYVHGTVDFVVR